ncbi:MAG: GTP cyclohydrolase MptA [Thermoplasmatota archaeon]
MKGAPDVQAEGAPRPYALTRVGVKGVRKPVTVRRPGSAAHATVALFDLFVDLPKTQKGTHMSRNLEALADILDEELGDKETPSLEALCLRLARRLLHKHESASHAAVHAVADLFLVRRNPTGKPTLEGYQVAATSQAWRSGEQARRIGVEVVGMTACPCAMATVRHSLEVAGHALPAAVPAITHNQRNRVALHIDLPAGAEVEAADLVDLCEAGLSAPTFELLKRGDEGALVLGAHRQPRFVEDVVREVLHAAAERYRALGPEVQLFVSSEAEESIHKHNAYAERLVRLGEL